MTYLTLSLIRERLVMVANHMQVGSIHALQRQHLQESDILPSATDHREMFAHATKFVMRFLVKRFTSLKELTKLCPLVKPHKPAQKTKAVPLEILDIDEGMKDNNITILESFKTDLKKTDSKDVVKTSHTG